MKNYKIVLSEGQIADRIKELGKEITKDYQGKKPLVICMLKGAILFFSDLIRNIDLPLTTDFARISSYGNGTTSGNLKLVSDLMEDVTGKDVIIVEDVVDSGKTLAYFIERLKQKNPSSVKICTFLDKPERRVVNLKVDYVGFCIHCGFVVGYGLDYAERYRELPYLAEIESAQDLMD